MVIENILGIYYTNLNVFKIWKQNRSTKLWKINWNI